MKRIRTTMYGANNQGTTITAIYDDDTRETRQTSTMRVVDEPPASAMFWFQTNGQITARSPMMIPEDEG